VDDPTPVGGVLEYFGAENDLNGLGNVGRSVGYFIDSGSVLDIYSPPVVVEIAEFSVHVTTSDL
jgi:hypothetical protein